MDLEKLLSKTKARNVQLKELAKLGDVLPVRIATEDRPYDLDFEPVDGSTPTSGRKASDQWTEGLRPVDTSGRKASDQWTEGLRPVDTSGRKASDQWTEASQPVDGSPSTSGRKQKVHSGRGGTSGRKALSTEVPVDGKGGTSGRKASDQWTEAPHEQGTSRRKNPDQWTEAPHEQGTSRRKDPNQWTEACVPVDGREPPKSRPPRPQKSHFPRVSAQRDILFFLRHSLEVETGATPYLSYKQIAQNCRCTLDTVRKSIYRLTQKQIITGVARSFSCKHGGAVYSIPKSVVRWVDESLEFASTSGRKTDMNQWTEADVSSSSLKTTSKPQTLPPTIGELQLLVTRLCLDTFYRISANDLVAAQRVNGLPDEDHSVSIEHLAFYLGTDEAKGINHPKAFFLSQLRAGYFAPPVDFVSWEEKQLAAKVAAQKEKAQRLAALQEAGFEADFDVWFAELSPTRRLELARETGAQFSNVEGRAFKLSMREIFSKETGRILPEALAT